MTLIRGPQRTVAPEKSSATFAMCIKSLPKVTYHTLKPLLVAAISGLPSEGSPVGYPNFID